MVSVFPAENKNVKRPKVKKKNKKGGKPGKNGTKTA
jgi:hypothetical protein